MIGHLCLLVVELYFLFSFHRSVSPQIFSDVTNSERNNDNAPEGIFDPSFLL